MYEHHHAARAKREGDTNSKTFLCSTWKQRNERLTVVDVSIINRSKNRVPFRKECVVNGQMTKAGNK